MTKATYLFTVSEVFAPKNRGLVLMPGVSVHHGPTVRVGDTVELRRPDGQTLTSVIQGYEHVNPLPPLVNYSVAILVRSGLVENDVPVGTEVWLIEA
jgi:hypothetical protein